MSPSATSLICNDMSRHKCFIDRWEITAEQSWQLLEWCRSQGATEFTLRFIEPGDVEAQDSRVNQTRALLAPFRLPVAERPGVLWSEDVEQSRRTVRPTELWALNFESFQALRQIFGSMALPPEVVQARCKYTDMDSSQGDTSLFNYHEFRGTGGWIETPEIYRDSELLLAVVSDESRAVLWISEQEWAELTAIGIPISDDPEWLDWI